MGSLDADIDALISSVCQPRMGNHEVSTSSNSSSHPFSVKQLQSNLCSIGDRNSLPERARLHSGDNGQSLKLSHSPTSMPTNTGNQQSVPDPSPPQQGHKRGASPSPRHEWNTGAKKMASNAFTDQLKAVSDSQAKKLKAQGSKIIEQEFEIDQSNALIAKLRYDISESDVVELEGKISKLEASDAECVRLIERGEEKNIALRQKASELKTLNHRLDLGFRRQKAAIDPLKVKLLNSKKEISDLVCVNSNLRGENQTLKDKARDNARHKDTLESAVSHLTQDLKDQHDKSNAQAEAAEVEAKSFRRQIQALEHQTVDLTRWKARVLQSIREEKQESPHHPSS